MDREQAKNYAREIAWQNYGQPYKWGGDDAVEGFDCSGFVQEILYSVGALRDQRYHGGQDRTAAALLKHYKDAMVERPVRGCLVFWQVSVRDEHIRHVEFCLNENYSIGASGGGSKTTDEKSAAASNAFVKMRPIEGRGTIAGYVDPFAETAPWGK